MPSSGERIAVWPTPSSRCGRDRAELGDPAVVGLEARLLEVAVAVVAEHHPDGRVDHLGGHAVGGLVGEAGRRVPAATVEVLEPVAGLPDLLGRLAGGGRGAEHDRALEAVDHEHVAELAGVDEPGRPVPPGRVDVVDVRARRLGDVGVGRDDRLVDDRSAMVARELLLGSTRSRRCRLGAAHEAAGQRAGGLTVRVDLLAGHERVPVAVHVLEQPLAAGRQVEHEPGRVQAQARRSR